MESRNKFIGRHIRKRHQMIHEQVKDADITLDRGVTSSIGRRKQKMILMPKMQLNNAFRLDAVLRPALGILSPFAAISVTPAADPLGSFLTLSSNANVLLILCVWTVLLLDLDVCSVTARTSRTNPVGNRLTPSSRFASCRALCMGLLLAPQLRGPCMTRISAICKTIAIGAVLAIVAFALSPVHLSLRFHWHLCP